MINKKPTILVKVADQEKNVNSITKAMILAKYKDVLETYLY